MPYAAPTPCRVCGVATRGRYCPAHQKQVSRDRAASTAVYGRRWGRLAKMIRDGEPLCRAHADEGIVCDGGGKLEVDHIEPRPPGLKVLVTTPLGPDYPGGLVEVDTPIGRMRRWNGNLQPLCKPKHSEKTRREMNERGNR